MLRFLVDENFNNDILRGVRRRNPSLDLVRAQDVGLSGPKDPEVLEWAARAGRPILSHDVSTMTKFAYDRVRNGKRMPGLFEVGPHVATRQAIEEILIIGECSHEGEWEGQMRYLPLR